MSGTWHDTRGYLPRPFPYRDVTIPEHSGKKTNYTACTDVPYSPSHAVLSAMASDNSTIFVVDRSQRSSLKNVKTPNVNEANLQNSNSNTTLTVSLILLFSLSLTLLIGGAVYFTLSIIDGSDNGNSTDAPDQITQSVFAGTFTITTSQFITALNDELSQEYQQLANDIIISLDELYRRSSEYINYIGSDVNGFSEGSVIVAYTLMFRPISHVISGDDNGSPTTEVVLNIIREAVEDPRNQNSFFGSIDSESIYLKEVSENPSTVLPETTTGTSEVTGKTSIVLPKTTTEGFEKNITITLPSTTKYMEETETKPDHSDPTITTMPTLISSSTQSDTYTSRPIIGCGMRNNQANQRIVGGQEAYLGKWPWMVSLQFNGRPLCGATIIGDKWIVTAAHCTYTRNIYLLSAFVNTIDVRDDENGHYAQFADIVEHPAYNDDTNENDISLLRLQDSLRFSETVASICLEGRQSRNINHDDCFIAGWGDTQSDGTGSNVLLDAHVPVISSNECSQIMTGVTEDMFCAGYDEGQIDSCQGDSGGPLMCPDANRIWHLTGITSWGIGCALPNNPGVYTNVSQYIPWVLSVIQDG